MYSDLEKRLLRVQASVESKYQTIPSHLSLPDPDLTSLRLKPTTSQLTVWWMILHWFTTMTLMSHSQPTISYKSYFSYTLPTYSVYFSAPPLLACHGLKHHGWLDHWCSFSFFQWLWWGIELLIVQLQIACISLFEKITQHKGFVSCWFLICVYYNFLLGSVVLLPVNLHPKYVGFAVMRLDTRKTGSCLWLVMCVDFLFVDLVMSMKGVTGASAALNATPAIIVTKVRSVLFFLWLL